MLSYLVFAHFSIDLVTGRLQVSFSLGSLSCSLERLHVDLSFRDDGHTPALQQCQVFRIQLLKVLAGNLQSSFVALFFQDFLVFGRQ